MPARLFRVLFSPICLLVLLLSTTFASYGSAQAVRTQKSTAPQHSIHLNWHAPENSAVKVAGYNVYRSSDGGKKFRKLNKKRVPRPEYDDRTVLPGRTYLYRVKSVNAKGVESGPSNDITLKVP